jgi:hypothetical protein
VLVEQLRICTVGLPRDPDDEVVAEPPHLVGPTACTKFERSVSQIGMLIPQQIADEVGSQFDLGLLAEPIEEGHARERYPCEECRPAVTQRDFLEIARGGLELKT